MAKRRILAQEIAAILARELEDPQAVVPAIGAVARQHRCCYATAMQAAHLLARRGLIELRPGRAPRRKGRNRPGTSVEAALRLGLAQGEWRRGTPLPKAEVLAQRFACTRRDLAAACRVLVAEGLVHRRGRVWVVGPGTVRASSGEPPTVVLVGERQRFWRYQLGSSMAAFYRSCIEELDGAGLRLQFIDIEDVAAMRTAVGRRLHRGALVMSDAPPQHLDRILVTLIRGEGRVIVFDNADRHPRLTERHAVIRCTLGEEAAMREVVAALQAAGHQRIGVPVPPAAWCQRRAEVLRAAAADLGCDLHTTAISEAFWASDYSAEAFRSPEDFLAALAGPRRPTTPASIAALVRARCPGLFTLIDRERVSLILGLSDHYAREFQIAFAWAGVAVPQVCGLVGIDNHVQTPIAGLSTFDVGFDRLGYLAAHLLIGDLPVAVGRDRCLTSRLRLIDRGTLGPSGRAAR